MKNDSLLTGLIFFILEKQTNYEEVNSLNKLSKFLF